jgi:exopolysaccharide biosynthesis predicted pyruvyltransferase EpsI
MKKDTLITFLQDYKDKEIIFCANPGNAGDSLIALGTLNLFDSLGLKYKIDHHYKTYVNKTLFYGGGGNFVGMYSDCRNFLQKNKDNNHIVILPHTINNEDETLLSLDKNVIIFCRENKSYNYVKNIIKYKENVFLSNDMAFYINLDNFKIIKGSGVSNNFRTDCEKTDIYIPKNNNDLSVTLCKYNNTMEPNVIKSVSFSIFNYLNKYEIINTNRLHIAIAGSLLHKKVNFYSNSYYKNEEVYNHSIKEYFPNTYLINDINIINKIQERNKYLDTLHNKIILYKILSNKVKKNNNILLFKLT